jgi:hypothetical protein
MNTNKVVETTNKVVETINKVKKTNTANITKNLYKENPEDTYMYYKCFKNIIK